MPRTVKIFSSCLIYQPSPTPHTDYPASIFSVRSTFPILKESWLPIFQKSIIFVPSSSKGEGEIINGWEFKRTTISYDFIGKTQVFSFPNFEILFLFPIIFTWGGALLRGRVEARGKILQSRICIGRFYFYSYDLLNQSRRIWPSPQLSQMGR